MRVSRPFNAASRRYATYCCLGTLPLGASGSADAGPIFEKILLVIVTFLLTTVIGALWTSFLTAISWRRQTKVDLFRKRYDEGTKFLDDLSLSIGTRFYLIQRFFWAIRDEETEKIPSRETDYFVAVKD